MMPLVILVFVVDLLAVINVINSRRTAASKAGWIAAILLLPLLGALAWLLAGPQRIGRPKFW